MYIHQHHVATDAEFRQTLGKLCCLGEGASAGHKRGRTDHPAPVRLDDGAIYARGEPKIVGIDDEAAHAASLAGRRMRNTTMR